MSTKRSIEGSKRTSNRTVVLSKAFRVVDSETRKHFREKRLQSLEADNYVENNFNESDDEAFSVEENDQPVSKKEKRSKKSKVVKSKWSSRRVKPLESLVYENIFGNEDVNGEPNYLSAKADISCYPSQDFCSVCGYFGNYSCTRCGLHFCSLRCNNQHKETRCMKFSI